ncbi:antirestriction protein ArdC [Glycocaulis profundi]|nr:antirestriction protein ArdC [Glycocaulis profundi]
MVFTFQPPFWAGLSGYIAEMGAAFLCAALGIVPTVRHADYLAAWLDVLREDNRAIFGAAGQASRAADFLLAFTDPPDGPGAPAAEAPADTRPERIAA